MHELTHLAFPSVPARHRWIEEGLATYVEPIARAQAGLLDHATAWSELRRGLPKGLPAPGDGGLDHTPTWGRTFPELTTSKSAPTPSADSSRFR